MPQGRRCLRQVQHEEGLQIAPMIDVTLLLLFFFRRQAHDERKSFWRSTFRRPRRERIPHEMGIGTSSTLTSMANSSPAISL
jgi:hypothetical protein